MSSPILSPAAALSSHASRSVVAGAAAVGVAVLLAGAWAVPSLAILVVWPLLFVVPGWGIVAWTRPRLAATGRLGLAIVLSVALATHLVWWLAMVSGDYRREVIFAAAAVLAMPIPIAAWRGGPTGVIGWPLRAVRRSWAAFGLAALSAVFVSGVLAVGMWRVTREGVSAGGSNWSDLGVHLSIAESLNAGNFPPDVPYFAGVPLVYHWFADFHVAIAAEAAGLFSIPVMIVQSAVLAGALALLMHGLASRLLGGRGARRAALIAVALVIFGGGMGWLRFGGDLATGVGGPLELIERSSYDNQWLTGWPYFRIPSVMGTGLLAHRATAAGLPILVGVLLLLSAGLPTARRRLAGDRDRLILIGLAGLLGALLAPFHFFFFPAMLLLALLYVVIGGRMIDDVAVRNAALFLAPFLLALPFVVAPLVNAGGSGALKLVGGWESAPLADGPAAVLFFYLTNLGVPFVLALAALFARHTPRRLFLGAWLLAMFAVPNVVQMSVISFDMNKYFQAMWIAVALLAAWLIRRWPAMALVAVFLLSVPSPLLVAGWTTTSRLQVLTTDERAAAEWVAANTPDRSVFVTDGFVNSLTDAAGRLRLTTFGPYVANLGYAPDERTAQVARIYCAGDAAASSALMRTLNASYVIDAARPSPCPTPTDFAAGPFEQVYANPSLRIWRLTEP